MNKGNLLYNKNIRQWAPHICGMLVLFVLPILVWQDTDSANLIRWQRHFYSQLIFLAITFYTNYLFLFPQFYKTEKKSNYFIFTAIFIAIMLVAMQLWFDIMMDNEIPIKGENSYKALKDRGGNVFFHPRTFDNLFFLILISSLSTSLSFIQRKNKEEKELEQKEKAHIDTELAFLRNQISPHFFFNALNNIYALIAIDGEKAQESVEKLSDLMRYLIYESDIKKVPIQKEFDFAKNYIALMKQRLSKKVQIEIEIEDPEQSVEIPPLLFIPFIENAFKHGVSYREQSKIAIAISSDQEFLYFHCQNAIVQNKEATISKQGGLGIQNIEKRLELLYNKKANLSIREEDNQFIVDLKIPLQQLEQG